MQSTIWLNSQIITDRKRLEKVCVGEQEKEAGKRRELRGRLKSVGDGSLANLMVSILTIYRNLWCRL